MADPASIHSDGFTLPLGGGDSVHVSVRDRDTLLQRIEARLAAGQGFTVATLNLDHMVKLHGSSTFRRAYAAQDFVVADGNPIAWLSRLAGQPVEIAPGSELIGPICQLAARLGAPVAFLGSTQEALSAAAAVLQRQFPGLYVVETIAPPRGFDPEGEGAKHALETIAASRAKICFLALGAPKQEILAIRGRLIAPACGFVSIGAGLDFIAGTQTRAPGWVRAIAMEWFWRMASNPRRLLRRYVLCALALPVLACRVMLARWRRVP